MEGEIPVFSDVSIQEAAYSEKVHGGGSHSFFLKSQFNSEKVYGGGNPVFSEV